MRTSKTPGPRSGPGAPKTFGYTDLQRAGDRTRTGDVQLGKLAFYQLNYARDSDSRRRKKYTGRLLRPPPRHIVPQTRDAVRTLAHPHPVSMRFPALIFALLGAAACASAAPTPAPSADRILVVGADGSIVRQSTANENSRSTYAVPPARVWPALVTAYTTLGIQPTKNDRAAGEYGNAGFLVPRRIVGRPIADFFSCGSGITGPRIDNGRVYGNVMSVLSDDGSGGSVVVTYVSAYLTPNTGSASDPIVCASTGALEQLLQKNIRQALGTP